MQNIIDRIPRSAIGVVIAGALVIAPAAVFANGSNVFIHNDDQEVSTAVKAPAAAPTVSIGAKGNLTVKGATVTAVNGSTITATTVWGGNTLTWTVGTASSTDFLYHGGKDATLATVAVNDNINFSGALSGNSLTVAANAVRDNSKEKSAILEKHTFEGKLNGTIGTTSLPTSFGLTIGSSNYAIIVPANTPILNKNWASINLGSFVSGDTVRVYGSAEASNTNSIDAVVVRDASR